MKIAFAKTKTTAIDLDGGIITEASQVSIPPGALVSCINHELVDPKGYSRVDGYERIDGNITPSDALFTYLGGDVLVSCSKGETVTFSTSGAKGILLDDFQAGDAGIAVYVSSGTPVVGEDVYLDSAVVEHNGETVTHNGEVVVYQGVIIDQIDSIHNGHGAPDATTAMYWRGEAMDAARAYVEEVPGSDKMTGAFRFNGTLYAFRDSTDGKNRMYRGTSSGWEEIDLGRELKFASGTGSGPAEGNVITGQTSGATATVVKVQVLSGAFGTNDAAGVITLAAVTGTFQDGEGLRESGGSSDFAAADGADYAVERLAGGLCELINYNFSGNPNDLQMFGTDGVNQAFGFKEPHYVRIFTGMENSGIAPKHVTAHQNHLFLAYHGSWMVSGIGDPFSPWTTIYGGDEWALGDVITGACVTPSGTLVSFCKNAIDIIYGSSTADFTVKRYSDRFGALEYSIASTVGPTYVSSTGINILQPSDKFGDFESNAIDVLFRALVEQHYKQFTCAVISHEKRSYIAFFGRYCIRVKFSGNQVRGATLCYYPFRIRMAYSIFREPGTKDIDEQLFITEDDGYVYRLDSGPSFDGESVVAYMLFAPNFDGSPLQKKKWYESLFEVVSSGRTQFQVKHDYDAFQPARPPVAFGDIDVNMQAGRWDRSKWDNAVFGGEKNDMFHKVRAGGVSTGLKLLIYSENKHEAPYVIKSIIQRYSYRGRQRV